MVICLFYKYILFIVDWRHFVSTLQFILIMTEYSQIQS